MVSVFNRCLFSAALEELFQLGQSHLKVHLLSVLEPLIISQGLHQQVELIMES